MARQKLGQHFLSSDKILQRIADAACGERSALTIEIGPGKGALTAPLLERSDRLVSIEVDRELTDFVRDRWKNEPRFEVLEANALEVDWSRWGAGVLVGNLPYYIATALISKYLHAPGLMAQGVFLIQKEVAERIVAIPGTREYGYFSVECGLLANVEYLFTVPPGAFRPPPKVESAVIRLTPQAHPPDVNIDHFLRFVSACFRQKRKTLRNNLSGHYSREILDHEPRSGMRAEQLSIADLLDLYRELARGVNPPTA